MRLTQSGDGIAAALLLMRALEGRPLEQGAVMEKLPQCLVNIRVADREALAGATAVWQAVEAEQSALDGRGRVLVRPSGTEPLVRLMAEAPDEERVRAGRRPPGRGGAAANRRIEHPTFRPRVSPRTG